MPRKRQTLRMPTSTKKGAPLTHQPASTTSTQMFPTPPNNLPMFMRNRAPSMPSTTVKGAANLEGVPTIGTTTTLRHFQPLQQLEILAQTHDLGNNSSVLAPLQPQEMETARRNFQPAAFIAETPTPGSVQVQNAPRILSLPPV